MAGFGAQSLVFVFAYLVVLVAISVLAGWRERHRRVGDALDEHELGGRDLPLLVLLGTLYATQYSGNSFIGFTGKAARDGLLFLNAPLIMQAVIVGYLLFAPQLFTLSRQRRYRTPGDFLLDRYDNRPLHLIATAIMIFALLNFLLSQLVAIGQITVVLGQGVDGGGVPATWGIVIMAVLMVVYENIGGMRAVAWTDMLQGLMLLVAVCVLFVVVEARFGGFASALTFLAQRWPEKVGPPTGRQLLGWIGATLTIGVGASVYPQAIQRVYAARSVQVLRQSMAIMALMPFVTTLPLILVGIKAEAVADAGGQVAGEQALPFLLRLLGEDGGVASGLVVLMILAGAVAAMMSTADSALLTLSSIVNRDVLERYLMPGRSVSRRLRSDRIISWVVALPLSVVASWAVTAGVTVWRILSVKLELLAQLAPSIWFGVRGRRLRGSVALAGIIVGCVFTLSLWLLYFEPRTGAFALLQGHPNVGDGWRPLRKIGGLQVGVIGLGLNLAICAMGSARRQSGYLPGGGAAPSWLSEK